MVTVNTQKFNHAIVIGSSIAGLTAATVLADYFDTVTVIERDAHHQEPEFRKGVPQARHAHTLLPRGQSILDRMQPTDAGDGNLPPGEWFGECPLHGRI